MRTNDHLFITFFIFIMSFNLCFCRNMIGISEDSNVYDENGNCIACEVITTENCNGICYKKDQNEVCRLDIKCLQDLNEIVLNVPMDI